MFSVRSGQDPRSKIFSSYDIANGVSVGRRWQEIILNDKLLSNP
jgi:hypothetical protein